MTVALTGGVAYADGPSDGDPTSKSSLGDRHADPPTTPGASTTDPSERTGGLRNRPGRHVHFDVRERGTGHDNKTDATTKRSSLVSDSDTDGSNPAPADDGTKINGPAIVKAGHETDPEQLDAARLSTQASDATAKPWPPDRQARPGDRRFAGNIAALKPVSAQPRVPASSGPDPRSVPAQPHQRSASADGATLMVANIAPADPVSPSTSSLVGTVDVSQRGRQVIGLVSDVGVVAASAVYTVANAFAHAFGPNDFLGVPYALATALANTAAAASRSFIGAPLDVASPGRFPVTYGVIDGLTFFNPQQPPPGANDPSITVTAEHPLPIILLNGTTATQGTNWAVGAPVLANAGYKVYTFNYGNVTQNPNSPIQATADIRQSAQELSDEVDRVLAETHAEKVILIGHSQGGGILPAYYINKLGGADTVSQVIGIAPSNHGTDVDGLVAVLSVPLLGPLLVGVADLIGPALIQQAVGSDFQQEVYGEGDTRLGVVYTNIITMNDEVVTPYTQQALSGPNVTNIVLQERYPGYPAGHLGVVLSPQVWSIVLDALASNPEANPLADPLDNAALAA